MLSQLIIGTILGVGSSGTVAGFVYYDSLARMLKRKRTDLNDNIFVEGFTENQSIDWHNRYLAWCKEKGAHYELGYCTYCADCKKEAEVQAAKDRAFQRQEQYYNTDRNRCHYCGDYNCTRNGSW